MTDIYIGFTMHRMTDASGADRGRLWDTMVRFRVRVLTRMQSDLAVLEEQDLTLPKWLVVLGLMDRGPMTISELREHLGRSQAATSQLVDSLEARGLVKRRTDPADGRRSVVRPTRSATALAGKLEKARRDGFERVLGHLPSTVLNRLDAALTEVLEHLEKTP